tara:strand:- start:526 stop:873 length:348 start_codon:yes stop_codon:yes gene_type:complete
MAHVKVEGLVDAVLGDKGFWLIETIKTKDFMMEKKWKVWGTPIPPFGSFVEVTGEMSTKIAKNQDGTDFLTAQGNRYIDSNVNFPVIKVLREAEVASPDVNNEWATTPPTQAVPF